MYFEGIIFSLVFNHRQIALFFSPSPLPPLLRSSWRPILQPPPRSFQVTLFSLQCSQTPLERKPTLPKPNRLVSRKQLRQTPALLPTLINTEVQRARSLAISKSVDHRFNQRHALFQRHVRRQIPSLTSELAELVTAPRFPAARDELLQVAALDAATHGFALGVVHADVQRAVADAAESEIVASTLPHSRAGARVAVLAACVDSAAAVDVAAGMWDRAVQAV